MSFWNDNISYALRGCILIELALRRRIAMVRDPSRRRLPLADRLIEVIDERQTGETILDEALKMIKSSDKYGTGAWVDLMSGAYASRSKQTLTIFMARVCSAGLTGPLVLTGH